MRLIEGDEIRVNLTSDGIVVTVFDFENIEWAMETYKRTKSKMVGK